MVFLIIAQRLLSVKVDWLLIFKAVSALREQVYLSQRLVMNNGALTEQWCANFLIIDKAFWVLDIESIVLHCMVAMSNILQSSLSSCWRVLLQTFLSPDTGTNWVIYKDRFLWLIDARGLL